MISQCEFIKCNQCTTVVGDGEDGGGRPPVEAGDMWAVPVLVRQFCYELSTALKIKSSKGKLSVMYRAVYAFYRGRHLGDGGRWGRCEGRRAVWDQVRHKDM